MAEESKLEPGITGVAQSIVTESNTAVAMGSGEVEVFATPAVVALMEAAAVACLKGRLAPGETSVGTRMDMAHVAATPVGMGVRAEAELESVDGRKLVFHVCAYDEKERISEGLHERFVIQTEKFMSKVRAK
ncbi:MAG: thioesterase family protein [Acidobacteriota bacterium]